jgi:hypothetical protein
VIDGDGDSPQLSDDDIECLSGDSGPEIRIDDSESELESETNCENVSSTSSRNSGPYESEREVTEIDNYIDRIPFPGTGAAHDDEKGKQMPNSRPIVVCSDIDPDDDEVVEIDDGNDQTADVFNVVDRQVQTNNRSDQSVTSPFLVFDETDSGNWSRKSFSSAGNESTNSGGRIDSGRVSVVSIAAEEAVSRKPLQVSK